MRGACLFALCVLACSSQRAAAATLPPEAVALILDAGNTESDSERNHLLEKLATIPGLDETLKAEASALADLARRWDGSSLKFYTSAAKGKGPKAIGDYDFKVGASSPLQPLTEIYRGRMLAWTLIENSTVRTSSELAPWFKDEAVKSFQAFTKGVPAKPHRRHVLGQSDSLENGVSQH